MTVPEPRLRDEPPPFDVAVNARGRVSDQDRAYATRSLHRVVDPAAGPVRHARIDLDDCGDEIAPRPASAKVEVEIANRVTRAHATAITIPEAIDFVMAKLRRRLDDLAELGPESRIRRRRATSWRRSGTAPLRSTFTPRAAEDREVVRYKCFPVAAETIDEAAHDLEVVDHDFYLFRNVDTGEDNVIARTEDGYELYEPSSSCALTQTIAAIRHAPIRPEVRSIEEARTELDHGDRRFVFFLDRDSGRGRVLYRRYDGHYGVVVPGDGSSV